jgi:OHCU decarboxylase
MDLARLNEARESEFVDVAGLAFEASPWVAARAWHRRPFESLDALHRAMTAVVDEADREQQLQLIRAHPDLAGRVAREGRLTPASQGEQSSAGLDRLTGEERARFEQLNGAYRERFGFPFVICVRDHDKAGILDALERRAANGRDAEIATALAEISKIARYRLRDAIRES